MLVYPSSIDLSTRTLRFLTGQLTARRREIGTRWRRLPAARQALLALAHLRCGDTYAQLAAGFGIGIATAFRYIREAVDTLATLAPSLAEAIKAIRAKAFVILDGTLLPIDRIAADTPYYSGKHKRHGMNVQVLTDPFGRLLWASPALPGSTHDLTAARQHGIIEALAEAGLRCWADGDVSDEFQTGHRSGEVTHDQVLRWHRLPVLAGQRLAPPPGHALDGVLAHDPRDPFPVRRDSPAVQGAGDTQGPVRPRRGIVDLSDLHEQFLVRGALRVSGGLPLPPSVVAGSVPSQQVTHFFDSVFRADLVDEAVADHCPVSRAK